MNAAEVTRILTESNRTDLALARTLETRGGDSMKKAKAAKTRPASAKAKTARKPREPKPVAAGPRPVAFVIPGAYVTAAVFSTTDHDKEVVGWARDAMVKAGKERGSVNVTDVLHLTGEVAGFFVLARYTAEGRKALVAVRLALRNAAKATLREAGYVVRRALP